MLANSLLMMSHYVLYSCSTPGPDDYHRKITCGNSKCVKEFGFYEFNVSDRVLKDVKMTIKREHEQKAKV